MSSITLYKATDELRKLLDQVDPETGELPAELGHVGDLVKSRSAAVAAVIANTELQISAVEARLKEAKQHVEAQKRRVAWLRQYLLENMARVDAVEIRSEDALLVVRRLPERDAAVDVFDEKQIPTVYMTAPEPPAPKPDKAAIKRAIEAGQDVPGARIVKRDRLVIG